MASDPNSPRHRALSYISDSRFHHRFSLPATADHDSLNVTYAVAGHTSESPQRIPTILFMPGMFASRYMAVQMHAIAAKLGVRVLVVDRPGMGNTSNVPIDQRVQIWLELVPRLLAHLGIDHVSLLSHSAGTIYLLNTLYHCRGILHPERPYAVLLAPWVDPAHSRVTSMQLAQLVPEKAFIAWHLIPRFMLLTAKPVLASSGAVVTKLQGSVSSGSSHSRDLSQVERTRERIETEYGLPKDVQAELATLTVRFLFQEQSVGANDEALQCLRKGPRRTWGKCEDYALFVKELADAERRAGRARLKIQAYFAEEDSMIGKKGQRYVEECFSRRQDVLDFESITVPGVDHDGLSQCAEVLNSVFREVATQT